MDFPTLVDSRSSGRDREIFASFIPELEHQANTGNVEAKFILGIAKHHGFATQKNLRFSNRYFKKLPAEANAYTEQLSTPLHDAVWYTIKNVLLEGDTIIVGLVKAGANLNAEAGDWRRPIDLADHFADMSSYGDAGKRVFELLKWVGSKC